MPFSVRVLVATSINAQASLCQTIWPKLIQGFRVQSEVGYNITCKALGISAIIKGSRGKRDSKGFKAIVNSLKTTQGLRESARSTKEGRGHSSRPVVTVENTTTEQAKVESCYMVPWCNLVNTSPFQGEESGFDSRWYHHRGLRDKKLRCQRD